MRKVALKGLVARRARVLSIALAVFLGVGLMSGAYVFTDTINRSFEDIFTEAAQGTDVAVSPRQVVEQDDREPPAFEESLLDRVEAVDGVAAAEGGVEAMGRIVDDEGDSLGSEQAPGLIFSGSSGRFDPQTYEQGRRPDAGGEVALDLAAAEGAGLGIGDRVGVAAEKAQIRPRIVGLTSLGGTSFGGAVSVTLTLAEAQRITGKQGRFDVIAVAAEDGVTPGELRNRIRAELPRSVEVRTGQQRADKQTTDIKEDLSFLSIILLVFAGMSLFVGSFLIFNTFSITVAQRMREFGMLRTLGASRRQILTSVVGEAALIGAIGSVLGLLGGFGFAAGISALFKAFDIDLPNQGTVLATRTVVVALVVGMTVTLVSALFPALRATRVTPMAALAEGDLPDAGRRGRVVTALAVLLVVAGLAMTSLGLFGGLESSSQAAGLMGGGAVLVILGVAIFSPLLVRPLASATGRPIERLTGLTGRLARENAIRKPGRTAATAAALMIGVALVSFVTVFAAGISGSIGDAIDKSFAGDIVLQNQDGFSPIPVAAGQSLTDLEGVDTVSSVGRTQAKVKGAGDSEMVGGVDTETVGQVLKFDWVDGSDETVEGLGATDAIISDSWAASNDVDVGDTIEVTTPTGKALELKAVGSFKDSAGLFGSFLVTDQTLSEDFGNEQAGTTYLALAEGADAKAVQNTVEQRIKRDFPSVEVLNQSELKESQRAQINQLLALIYALLSLAVIVSLFGIVNTLALSILERTRELGLLRAVGMSRKQVKRIVRYEAVITALIGAVLGMVLGVVFSVLVSRPLADEGFSLSFPIVNLLILLVLAALAGVAAAILPSRRAAKLDVLRALSYE